MDNLAIIVDDWIRSLRTMDLMRSQVYIERIQENFQLFNAHDQRSLILTFLRNIQTEHSEIFIKNYISCLSIINQSSIVSSLELLQNTVNPLVSKYLLESSINKQPQVHENIDALVSHCMSEPFSALFAYTISLIVKKNLNQYLPSLKFFYSEQSTLLIKHFNGAHSLNASEYGILLENIYAILFSLHNFKVSDVIGNYKRLLSTISAENIYSKFDPIKKKLSKVISQLFFNIACIGDNKSYLLMKFNQEPSEQVKVAILHKLSEPNGKTNSENMCELLIEIAKNDDYFAFAVASMVKIGGQQVKNYILSELSSGKYRRVFFTTYFLPYLNFTEDIYDAVIEDLLTYKQPLILKQTLWVIRKKKLQKYLTHAIKLLFHENAQVKREAQKVLLEAPATKTIDHLTKNINYYGPEKQEVISHLIAKLRKLNL